MKKLAIISSYNESCGNASYTHVLKSAFSEHVEVEVIPLDLFVLQKKGAFYERHGDNHIDQIAKKLAGFDYVNIQFEAGLYGPTPDMVHRRIAKLIAASKSLVLTMHRVDPPEMGDGELLSQVTHLRLHPWAALKMSRRSKYARLYRNVVKLCQEHAKKAPCWIAIHTRREYRIIKDLYGFDNVFQFPITFLQEGERKALQQSSDPAAFRQRHHIPDGVKVIGAFGFVSKYKGYESLLRALAVLPNNYHLYIFGGQHPQSLKINVPLDPYLQELFDLIAKEDERLINDKIMRIKTLPSKLVPEAAVQSVLQDKLMDRVHFMGGLSDPEFIEALRFSDFTVLPYLEVGQSMSGVISLAIEAGANLFCTTNHSFNEARKMFGDVYHTFDVGNHMELAQKLQSATKDFTEQRDKAYQQYNIHNNVRKHLEVMGHAFAA